MFEQTRDINLCYSCGKLLGDDRKKISTYWNAERVFVCPVCTNEENIIACQKIDADCNDCKFFLRGEKVSKGIFEGICKKDNSKVLAYPVHYSGHECFVHRKDLTEVIKSCTM